MDQFMILVTTTPPHNGTCTPPLLNSFQQNLIEFGWDGQKWFRKFKLNIDRMGFQWPLLKSRSKKKLKKKKQLTFYTVPLLENDIFTIKQKLVYFILELIETQFLAILKYIVHTVVLYVHQIVIFIWFVQYVDVMKRKFN